MASTSKLDHRTSRIWKWWETAGAESSESGGQRAAAVDVSDASERKSCALGSNASSRARQPPSKRRAAARRTAVLSSLLLTVITACSSLWFVPVCARASSRQARVHDALRLRGGQLSLRNEALVKQRLVANQSCRSCGRGGHNSRTCPLRSDNAKHNDTVSRVCSDCAAPDPSYGVAALDDEALWVKFLCKPCALHSKDAIEPLRQKCLRCRTVASFGPPGQGRRVALHCKRHREETETNVISRFCEHPSGCAVRATFGDSAEGVLRYCASHRKDHHTDLVHRRCSSPGCRTHPSFGVPHSHSPSPSAERRPRHCRRHSPPAAVDVVKPRCSFAEGCPNAAMYGPTSGPAVFCFLHRLSPHVDRASRRCQALEGCWVQPRFGEASEGVARYCALHRATSHVDVVTLRRKHGNLNDSGSRRGPAECQTVSVVTT